MSPRTPTGPTKLPERKRSGASFDVGRFELDDVVTSTPWECEVLTVRVAGYEAHWWAGEQSREDFLAILNWDRFDAVVRLLPGRDPRLVRALSYNVRKYDTRGAWFRSSHAARRKASRVIVDSLRRLVEVMGSIDAVPVWHAIERVHAERTNHRVLDDFWSDLRALKDSAERVDADLSRPGRPTSDATAIIVRMIAVEWCKAFKEAPPRTRTSDFAAFVQGMFEVFEYPPPADVPRLLVQDD